MKTAKVTGLSFLPGIFVMAAIVTSAVGSTGVVGIALSQTMSNQTVEEMNQTAAELNQTLPESMNKTAVEVNQSAAELNQTLPESMNQTAAELNQSTAQMGNQTTTNQT